MMPDLLRSLDAKNLEAQTVTLSRPSLDDVFLKYTGRSLREDQNKMKILRDTKLMFIRNMQHTLRSPVFVFVSMFQPLMYLLLFMPLLNGLRRCSWVAFWENSGCFHSWTFGSASALRHSVCWILTY